MRVTIQTVAQLTTLSSDTIRIWERRYRAVVPERSSRGVRLYSAEDIRRLTMLATLVKRGERISHLSSLADDELEKIVGASDASAPDAAATLLQAHAGLENDLRRESAAALFGRSAATSDLLHSLYDAAVRSVAQGLATEYAAVLEIDDTGSSLALCAQQGWPAVAGEVRVPLDSATLPAVAFTRGEPVVITDRAREKRFQIVEALRGEPIQSAIAVPYGVHNNGGVISAHSRASRSFDAEDIAFVQSIARILTVAAERAEAYSELQRANEAMSDLIGSFVTGFATIDLNRRITYVHPAFAARTPMHDLVGRPAEEVFPHLRETKYAKKLEEAIEGGRAVHYEAYSEQFQGWYEVYWQPVSGGMSVHFRDITMRKLSEFALEGRGAFAKMVLRSVPGAYWTTDNELIVVSASGKLLRMLALPKNQILGRHVSEAFQVLGDGDIVTGHRRALTGASAHLDIGHARHQLKVFVEPLRDSSPVPIGTIAFAIATE